MSTCLSKQLKAGDALGNLVVVEQVENKNGARAYLVRCACGEEFTLRGNTMRANQPRGCSTCTRADPKTAIRLAYASYHKGAAKRGLVFEISYAEFEYMAQQECFYCGAPPEHGCWSRQAAIPVMLNGVDRVKNEIGYVLDNCVPCCKICNRAKSYYNQGEFFRWVHRIVQRHNIR